MLEIIAGGIVALTATAFGAWLTYQQTSRSDEQRAQEENRRHAREVLAAARLVWFELGAAAISVESAAESRNVSTLRGIPRTAWATHGALLAADLPPDVFGPLAEVVARLGVSSQMVTGVQFASTQLDDEDEAVLALGSDEAVLALGSLARECREVQDTLATWINSQDA